LANDEITTRGYMALTFCRRRAVRYFDKDQRKHDYARSISRKTRQGLDWFKPSQRVIALRPVSLYYAIEKLVAPDVLWDATYIVKRAAL
jgi:hypothetical protein